MSQKFKEFAFKVLSDKDASELTFFSTGYNDVLQEGEPIQKQNKCRASWGQRDTGDKREFAAHRELLWGEAGTRGAHRRRARLV